MTVNTHAAVAEFQLKSSVLCQGIYNFHSCICAKKKKLLVFSVFNFQTCLKCSPFIKNVQGCMNERANQHKKEKWKVAEY